MKIDIVIGNPPYQSNNDGGNGNGATAIYNQFVENSMHLNTDIVYFIIPARWFTGGRGVDKFRDYMVYSKSVKNIIYYPNSKDIFNQLSIAGGICCCMLDKRHNSDNVEYTIIKNNNIIKSIRKMNEFGIFISDNMALSIIRKLKASEYMSSIVKSVGYYKIPTNYSENYTGNNRLKVITSSNEMEISEDRVYNKYNINTYRVFLSTITVEHAGEPDKDDMYKVFGRIGILEPMTVCSDSYIVIGEFDNRESAESLISYLKSKLVRFIVQQFMVGIHITQKTFSNIPIIDFSHTYSDDDIYKIFGITTEEIKYIDNIIKPMN